MTHLFHGIAKIIIIKLIYIELTSSKHSCKSKNIINLKKLSATYNTKKYFETIVKLNIIFITFSGENLKKMLSNLTKKNNKNLLLKNNIKSSIY